MSTFTHTRRITAALILAVAIGSASRAASRAGVDFAAKLRSWRDNTFKGFRMQSCQPITNSPATAAPRTEPTFSMCKP